MFNTIPHLEVIAGTMFSGKTKELLRRLSVYRAAELKTQVIKPAIDTRYGIDKASTHDGQSETADYVPGDDLEKLSRIIAREADVVGIEEAQFFATGLAEVCNRLIDSEGKIVVVSGLLNDYQEKPFPTMQELIRYADQLDQLTALCQYRQHLRAKICGSSASRVVFLGEKIIPKSSSSSPPLVKIGGAELYSPRCRSHYNIDKKQ